jgi:glycogen operon protein
VSDQTSESRRHLLATIGQDVEFVRGSPLPLGATPLRCGVNFSIFAKHSSAVTLVIFLAGSSQAVLEFPLDPKFHKTGDVWHCFLAGLDPGVHYAYRIDNQLLLDPYGKAVAGRPVWGENAGAALRSVVVEDRFAWKHDQPLGVPLADSIIYELHVRGFTRHPSSGAAAPGTFIGLCEKIPYLKDLGITAVELLPVTEFNETENPRRNPLTGESLLDYWGYNPISFFSPKRSYSAAADTLAAVDEFKTMVQTFHAAGIEVILDVVFNHTGEGGRDGPTVSWRGIDDLTYYITDPVTGQYLDYSGCGNTINCNHPVVRNQIVDCLRYWVTEMHVDGFRFDLASILGRGQDGTVLKKPPLLEQIAADPVLAGTKLIAEAWDAAGLYQVGSFPAWGRWAEWNGKFRDDIRRFVKGDAGMGPALADRVSGSADLYQESGREPYHSINFVTCHDGFTLADLVSYNEKHNEANGEGNRDGMDDNHSWNCGVEGPTTDVDVRALRERQVRNLAVLLLVAHGTPMITAGDELGRSQKGNNNGYCQDNELSWMPWQGETSNANLLRFFRNLIAIRRSHAILRRRSYVRDNTSREVTTVWHGVELHKPDWSWGSHLLAWHMFEAPETRPGEQIYVIANAHWEAHSCALPPVCWGKWRRLVDTSLGAPKDIAEPDAALPEIRSQRYRVAPRSVVVLVAR